MPLRDNKTPQGLALFATQNQISTMEEPPPPCVKDYIVNKKCWALYSLDRNSYMYRYRYSSNFYPSRARTSPLWLATVVGGERRLRRRIVWLKRDFCIAITFRNVQKIEQGRIGPPQAKILGIGSRNGDRKQRFWTIPDLNRSQKSSRLSQWFLEAKSLKSMISDLGGRGGRGGSTYLVNEVNRQILNFFPCHKPYGTLPFEENFVDKMLIW